MKIRPATQQLQAMPWLSKVKIGSTSLQTLLDQQVQFGIVGTGPMSRRLLVPQTEAAQQLLAGESGKTTRKVLHGLLAELDGKEGATNLRGVSFATSLDGYTASLLVSHLEDGFFKPLNLAPAGKQELETDLKDIGELAKISVAATHGYLDLGADASETLMSLLKNPGNHSMNAAVGSKGVVSLLLHEVQHSVTPPIDELHNRKSFGPVAWIEEGTAETLARWPGAVQAAGKRMGLPIADEAIPSWYPPYLAGMRRVLDLAGIDSNDPAQRGRADKLLQSALLSKIPKAIAKAIVHQNGLPAGMTSKVMSFLVSDPQKDAAKSLPAQITALENFVWETQRGARDIDGTDKSAHS